MFRRRIRLLCLPDGGKGWDRLWVVRIPADAALSPDFSLPVSARESCVSRSHAHLSELPGSARLCPSS